MINFRRANEKDQLAIQKVVFSVLEEYGLRPEPLETDRDLSDLEKFYFQNGGYFEVCEIDGKIVGTWGLHLFETNSCELRKMYLLPSLRGKGIGKKMLDRAIQKARELGMKSVELETASVLKEAIGMYQKYGFKQMTRRHQVERCDQAFEFQIIDLSENESSQINRIE
jgi:N-acetylglutamate synthase-like GNAT family acetyltransferase